MEPLFFELTEVLKQQRQVLQQMNGAAKQQSEALRQSDITALNKAVNELQKLALHMAKLDPQREELQRQLADQLGLAADSTLTTMLLHAPTAVKEQLTSLQRELRQQVNELQQYNELNRVLTERARQITGALLKIFNAGGQTYQQEGKLNQNDRPVQVLNKTV